MLGISSSIVQKIEIFELIEKRGGLNLIAIKFLKQGVRIEEIDELSLSILKS